MKAAAGWSSGTKFCARASRSVRAACASARINCGTPRPPCAAPSLSSPLPLSTLAAVAMSELGAPRPSTSKRRLVPLFADPSGLVRPLPVPAVPSSAFLQCSAIARRDLSFRRTRRPWHSIAPRRARSSAIRAGACGWRWRYRSAPRATSCTGRRYIIYTALGPEVTIVLAIRPAPLQEKAFKLSRLNPARAQRPHPADRQRSMRTRRCVPAVVEVRTSHGQHHRVFVRDARDADRVHAMAPSAMKRDPECAHRNARMPTCARQRRS